ncbi:MAG: MFS transporter [Lautropia sp.]
MLAAVVVTLLVQAMVVVAIVGPAVGAPVISPAFALPESAVGLYMALAYLGAVLSALYSGDPIRRHGPIRASQAGLMLCAIGLALLASARLPIAIAGAIAIGLGYGPITPASSDILVRTTPPQRLAVVFSIKQTGVPLGGVLAGLVVPALTLAIGWQPALLALAATCALVAAAAQIVRDEYDDRRGADAASGARGVLASLAESMRLVTTRAALRRLTVCAFVFAGLQLSLTTYLVSYLNLGLGWSLVAAGGALSATQAAGVVGRIGWGALSDAGLGARRTLLLLAALMIASCLSVGIVERDMPHALVLLLVIVFGASAVGWNGVFLAHIARVAPPGQVGAATGASTAFTFLGTVVWAPIFGLIADAAGYASAFAAFALPVGACVLLLGGARDEGSGVG